MDAWYMCRICGYVNSVSPYRCKNCESDNMIKLYKDEGIYTINSKKLSLKKLEKYGLYRKFKNAHKE